MKILLSAFSCGPDIGSEPGIGWHWAVEMARSGHEVLTLTEIEYQGPIKAALAGGGLPPGLRFEFFMPPWLDRLRHLGLRLGYESLTLHLVHLVWQIAAYRHVRSRLERERFDLVHHLTYGGIRHPTLMGRLGIPLVLGPVGGGERTPLALRRGLGWHGWVKDALRDLHTWLIRFDPITRRACADALAIYVKTAQSRDALPRCYHSKVAVQMEIGIQQVSSLPRPERRTGQPFRLLYAGRFIYWKGMDLGLRAFAEVRRRGGDVRLTMLGGGPQGQAWRGLARELGIERAVEWIDRVEHCRMSELYRSHDAVLFPSLHDSSGNVVLEALSYGLPVICLDLGGPGEIVDDRCGRVIATGGRSASACAHALADAIEEMSISPALCRRLGDGARARAANFLWPAQVGRVYADIAARLQHRAMAGAPDGAKGFEIRWRQLRRAQLFNRWLILVICVASLWQALVTEIRLHATQSQLSGLEVRFEHAEAEIAGSMERRPPRMGHWIDTRWPLPVAAEGLLSEERADTIRAASGGNDHSSR